MSWGRELKTVGAAMQIARGPKTGFVLRTASRQVSWERSVRDGRYRATDEFRYELVADERARSASIASLKSMRWWIVSQCSFCSSALTSNLRCLHSLLAHLPPVRTWTHQLPDICHPIRSALKILACSLFPGQRQSLVRVYFASLRRPCLILFLGTLDRLTIFLHFVAFKDVSFPQCLR